MFAMSERQEDRAMEGTRQTRLPTPEAYLITSYAYWCIRTVLQTESEARAITIYR